MPPVVTRLEPERPRSRCTLVEIDGQRIRPMPATLVTRLGLDAGDEVDTEVLLEQACHVEPAIARERAIYLLSHQERSCGDLLRRLTDEGYDPDVAHRLVADLEARGLVDDRRFAESMSRVMSARGYSRSRILRELARHRVNADLAGAVLDDALPEDDEYARALEIARRASRGREMDFRRLAGRLARKGFRPPVAFGAARQALAEEGLAAEGSDGQPDSEEYL
jgi:regulatory protein